MSPFLDAVLKLALIGFIIKFVWDAFVKLPQEKLEKQVEFLIARYADAILAHPNAENEIQRIKFQTDRSMNLPIGESEYANYTDENIEIIKRVYQRIQKYIEEEEY